LESKAFASSSKRLGFFFLNESFKGGNMSGETLLPFVMAEKAPGKGKFDFPECLKGFFLTLFFHIEKSVESDIFLPNKLCKTSSKRRMKKGIAK
jgi:hypothetical protein